eukprot:403356054
MRYSCKDQNVDDFRKTLRLNKFAHRNYNPNLDNTFGTYLFEGIMTDQICQDDQIKTVNDFILKEKTYKKAIKMSMKEILRLPKRMIDQKLNKSSEQKDKQEDSQLTIDPEKSAHKSRKRLYDMYAMRITQNMFTKKKLKGIETSLKTEMKRHKPRFYREISGDPDSIKKTLDRKREEQFYTLDEDDEKERKKIVEQAKQRLIVKMPEEEELKPKSTNLRDLIAFKMETQGKGMSISQRHSPNKSHQSSPVLSRYVTMKRQNSNKKQVNFFDEIISPKNGQQQVLQIKETQMFDTVTPTLIEKHNKKRPSYKQSEKQVQLNKILTNISNSSLENKDQSNPFIKGSQNTLKSALKNMNTVTDQPRQLVVDTQRQYASALVSFRNDKSDKQKQILVNSSVKEIIMQPNGKGLNNTTEQQRLKRKRIGTAKQRKNDQNFFSQDMTIQDQMKIENDSLQSPATTNFESNAQLISSSKNFLRNSNNQAISAQFNLMATSQGQSQSSFFSNNTKNFHINEQNGLKSFRNQSQFSSINEKFMRNKEISQIRQASSQTQRSRPSNQKVFNQTFTNTFRQQLNQTQSDIQNKTFSSNFTLNNNQTQPINIKGNLLRKSHHRRENKQLNMTQTLIENCLNQESDQKQQIYLKDLQQRFDDWHDKHESLKYALDEFGEEMKYSYTQKADLNDMKCINQLMKQKEKQDKQEVDMIMSAENLQEYKEDQQNFVKFLNQKGQHRKIWKPEKLVVPRYTYLGQVIAQHF